MGPGKAGRERCPKCDIRIFERIGLERRLRKLVVAGEEMGDGDGEGGCGICGMEYVAADLADGGTADLGGRLGRGGEGSSLGGELGMAEDGPELPVKLSCGHVFGLGCLFSWMKPKSDGGGGSNTCPMCRKQVLEL